MKRTFAILFLLLIIVAICVTEELVLKDVNIKLNTYSSTLYDDLVTNKQNINKESVKNKFSTLRKFWENEKNKLCYLTNYDKIKSMDESVSRLQYSIDNNDFSLAIDSISIVMSYSDFLHYFMGFNINNLF